MTEAECKKRGSAWTKKKTQEGRAGQSLLRDL